jgi:uncharacterized protein
MSKLPIDSYDSVMLELPETAVTDLLGHGYGVNQADACGDFLLTIACRRLQPRNVALLLRAGADTEVRDYEGNTPLICAIDVSAHNPTIAYDIATALMDAGAEIEARGYLEMTPYLKACSRGNMEILRALVGRGCNSDARDADDADGSELASIFHASAEMPLYIEGLGSN